MNQMNNKVRWALQLVLLSTILLSACKKEPSQAAIDEAYILDYVSANQLDGQFTASGLYYVISEPGIANHPTYTSTVTVDYEGYLLNGVRFDSGTGITFPLINVILGWQEGLQLIGSGGEIKLIIPSGLAYGSNAKQGIPANSILIFDVKLISFVP